MTAKFSLEETPMTCFSQVPVPPSLLPKHRCQELEKKSDNDSEGQNIASYSMSDRGPEIPSCSRISHVVGPKEIDTKKKFAVIAEPVELDINSLVSDRWCGTDTRSGWRKITARIFCKG